MQGIKIHYLLPYILFKLKKFTFHKTNLFVILKQKFSEDQSTKLSLNNIIGLVNKLNPLGPLITKWKFLQNLGQEYWDSHQHINIAHTSSLKSHS